MQSLLPRASGLVSRTLTVDAMDFYAHQRKALLDLPGVFLYGTPGHREWNPRASHRAQVECNSRRHRGISHLPGWKPGKELKLVHVGRRLGQDPWKQSNTGLGCPERQNVTPGHHGVGTAAIAVGR